MRAEALPQKVLTVLTYIESNRHERTLRDAENDLGPAGVYAAMLMAWQMFLVTTPGDANVLPDGEDEMARNSLPEYAYRRPWMLTERGRRAMTSARRSSASRNARKPGDQHTGVGELLGDLLQPSGR